MPKRSPTYEEAVKELQNIIDRLQHQTVGVDELAEQVQRATELIALCREKLRKAKNQTDKLFQEDPPAE
ncbi:MAG: hypothetical protein KatS3mg030_329 [Saprospiraceae bacterium]|nr:MAG: hypothetical protein KatS3mg030_329 [Saprospiraceae bacterium]